MSDGYGGGYIQGGVGFVVLAYGITWSVLLAYMVHLWHSGKHYD